MTAPSGARPTASPSPLAIGAALFLLSTATVLFTLGIFRLLSFFIMPSLFFDLLFVGFPLGAFLGVRFLRDLSERTFRGTLWFLQAVMFASIAATLACKHFDYLRAHLFEVRLDRLLVQMGTFTGLFLPFFCAYGLSEYVGYQVGRRRLAGRMSIVYGLYLFGAAAAYVFLELALASLGVSRVLGLSVLLVGLACLLVSPRGWGRIAAGGEVILLTVILALPGTAEQAFLDVYKGEGRQSTHDYRAHGFEESFQAWGRYSLTEILHSPERNEYAGFYNDLMQWEYSERYGFIERSLGMVPILTAPRDGSIAVIGSGGGRQVKWALDPRFDFRRIVALEVEPAVFDAVRGPLADAFGRVYEDPRVEPIVHEARSYMEASTESFDLIYLPSVGGYPQMMLEPGNMIRTQDAYRTLGNRLTDSGVLAIWYPRGLDPEGILTQQYVRTLRGDGLGLSVRSLFGEDEYLILASKSPLDIDVEAIRSFVTAPASTELALPPNPRAVPRELFVSDDADWRPIRDDRPFLAGNVSHIFSLEQLSILFAIVAGTVLVLGGALAFALRKSGDPKIPGRSYAQVAAFSFLIGANFLVFERCTILVLFGELYMFHDALVLGAISFLVLSGLGSALIRPQFRGVCQIIGAVCVVALVVLRPSLGPAGTLALVAPVAFVTGSFFPALFERSAGNPLAVFALDAIGAATGSLLAFFIPIAAGFDVFYPLAAGVFLVTTLGAFWFFRGLEGEGAVASSSTGARGEAADSREENSTEELGATGAS